jgi:hypothetical protein
MRQKNCELKVCRKSSDAYYDHPARAGDAPADMDKGVRLHIMTRHNPTSKGKLKVRGGQLFKVLDSAGFDAGKFVFIVSSLIPVIFSDR